MDAGSMTFAHAQHVISALRHILSQSLANETVSSNLLFIRGVSMLCVICNHICPLPSRPYIRWTVCVRVTAKPVFFFGLCFYSRCKLNTSRDHRNKILFYYNIFGFTRIPYAQRSNGSPYLVVAEKYSNVKMQIHICHQPTLRHLHLSILMSWEKEIQETELTIQIFGASNIFRAFVSRCFLRRGFPWKQTTRRHLHLRLDTVLSSPLAVRSKTSHPT